MNTLTETIAKVSEILADVQTIKYRIGRGESHWDSEARNRERVYERMAMIEKTLARVEDKLSEFDKKWQNGDGIPVHIKVDRLWQDHQRRDTWVAKWLAIGAIVIALMDVLRDFIRF